MRSTAAAGLAVVALVFSGCGGDDGSDSAGAVQDRQESAAAPSAEPTPGDDQCPREYAEPDPERPQIRLDFDISDDLSTVRGTEEVRFTPDRPVDELVFRLTANGPTAAEQGNSIRITSATAGGADQFGFEPAGAAEGTQGGLLVIPLDEPASTGEEITARLRFELTLGERSFERFGRSEGFAWWGTGQPLLAWERGVGWHREPLLDFVGESATSEAADIELSVTAPAELTVLSSGVQEEPVEVADDRRRWDASAGTARDISVAVGDFQTATRTVEGTEVTVGVPPDESAEQMLGDAEFAITELSDEYGPFPYPSLSLAQLPAEGGAIEYPGSVLMMGEGRLIVVHEVAHEWFYGMVGNSQARDPWLDEAFATYSERVTSVSAPEAALDLAGEVGASMTAFDRPFGEGGYFDTVYQKGGAALLAAREAAGGDPWDAALRCYINANAWQIAQPEDLASALDELPKAVDVLEKAGAL